jgi:hypothetical protein
MLRRSLSFGLVLVALLSTCAAQFRPCKFSDATTVDHIEGISVQRLTITDPSGSFGSTVFLPDADSRKGALFSHSSIHGNEANTNLLKFAWALARAGVAVLVFDGAIEWQIPSDASIRDPHLMACAGQWLTLTAHLSNDTDHSHLVVGTGLSLRGAPCHQGERPCFQPQNWLNFGETGRQAAFQSTFDMLTVEGVTRFAEFAKGMLHLKEINSDWLAGIVEPRSNQ